MAQPVEVRNLNRAAGLARPQMMFTERIFASHAVILPVGIQDSDPIVRAVHAGDEALPLAIAQEISQTAAPGWKTGTSPTNWLSAGGGLPNGCPAGKSASLIAAMPSATSRNFSKGSHFGRAASTS